MRSERLEQVEAVIAEVHPHAHGDRAVAPAIDPRLSAPTRAALAGLRPQGKRSRTRGFTIVELIVCMAVVGILCALLFPALRMTREASQRINCQSHMHAIGAALSAYANIHADNLPSSVFAEAGRRQPQELMTAVIAQNSMMARVQWDGLGWLVHGHYVQDNCECLFCPSHHGDHPFEREAPKLMDPGSEAIFTNYHYSGHVDRDGRRISFANGSETMLLTDGLRTRSDFNHVVGCNRLFTDLHIDWWSDAANSIERALPENLLGIGEQRSNFDSFWGTIAQDTQN